MKAKLICLLLLTMWISGQAQQLILYDTGSQKTRYLLSRTYEGGDSYTVSEIFVCESVNIRTSDKVCEITMSNACIYVTKIKQGASLHVTNSVAQSKAFSSQLTIAFPKDAKLIFNNSVMDLADFKTGIETRGRMVPFEGNALKEEMKRLGLGPPPDADLSR